MPETTTQKKRRLEKARHKYHQKRSLQTEEERKEILAKRRRNLNSETEDQRISRLVKQQVRTTRLRASETEEQSDIRRAVDAENHAEVRANETEEERNSRLAEQQVRTTRLRASETEEQSNLRRAVDAEHHAEVRANETEQQREIRLNQLREVYAQRAADINEFYRSVYTFSDRICDICLKQCYPNQIVKYRLVTPKSYLPQELASKNILDVCHRCNTHLKNNNKVKHPPKAYWNNLDPGEIPDVIKVLTQPEQRLLSRIIPFIKVVKYDGRFGQYGFKGNATLFALDIFEVSEALPVMLPRNSNDANIVVITETLENLNISREYTISRDRVYAALDWLIANNHLYHDVRINDSARLESEDIIRIVPEVQQQHENEQNINNNLQNAYIPLNNGQNISRILRASWNQGNSAIFENYGMQCLVMVLANIVRAAVLSPSQWDINILNSNMIEADVLYSRILDLTENSNGRAFSIPRNGYLALRNLDVIKDDFLMFNNSFSLHYDDNWMCNGCLIDQMNDGVHGKTLIDALNELFLDHNGGILISMEKSLGLMHHDGKYYFTDSHSCGPKGAPLKHGNGKGCIIECDTIQELLRIIRRVLPAKPKEFEIKFIDVNVKGNVREMEIGTVNFEPDQNIPSFTQHAPVQTSYMGPIDVAQPDVEDVLIESENLNEIVRKTGNNIVNHDHEEKAEEYAWFYLFPYGINGLKEVREVNISELDYFQFRILGKEPRFQSNNYLFYALATFEYHRIKSTISACCKSVRGRDGVVDDLHLYMKNLRGSAAYWRTAHNELIAQIRCLGPPTWFITLSCNDLNWLDMRKALLIADNRKDEDPANISIDEAQRLIELFPVVVSRQFMRRFNLFMQTLKKNDNALGGKIKDYWWRVEFQNRGSPHIHMVVWVENVPSFETEAGIQLIDNVISCNLPSEDDDPKLHDLVKRNQTHRHTHSCYKNNSEHCRFGFPRQISEHTRIISNTSDEFIRNCGRICILKRGARDKFINNYNPFILELWDGNIDIQPCGSNESIAHYIAKYISKSEPTNMNESVAQAIREIRREDTNISRKLFKACMRILKERQISACECVFRLCHLPFRESSRKCVFLNTRVREQRYHVIRFQGAQAEGFCSNIFKRYENRPRNHSDYNFEEMCLLEFAMLFEPYYGKNMDDVEESVDADNNVPAQRYRYISLLDNSKMRIRNIPAAVRVPFFNMHNDPENYFYSLLLQYVPYRSENELLEGYENSREAFLQREPQLIQRNRYLESFRERDRLLESAFVQARAFNIFEHLEQVEEVELEEELPDQGMNDAQFHAACVAMNLKQRELFSLVTRSIQEQLNGSNRRLRLFITGGAGVGKTYIFNLLKNQVNRCFGRIAAKVGAPTGVAARLVGGSTLHSLLKLPVQKNGEINPHLPPLTGNYLKIMRQLWRDIEFLFIDEISMVPYEILLMIDARLRQLKNNDTPFGGINIILFGDLMQLPPIRGAQVFHQPRFYWPATHLWRLFDLVELTDNMRQQGDTTFADLLNALRVGELNAQHFQLLMSKMLLEPTGEFALNKAIRIYPTRKLVNHHNEAVLEFYRASGERIYKIRAQDQVVEARRNLDNVRIESIVPTDINNTGGLPKELEIFVGAKVMLRSNIDLEKGLVNGAMGNITEIKWPHFRRDQMYDTDVPSVRIDFGRDGIHLIEPRAIQFPANSNYGTIERRMLPLILCFACTVHKMQGCTVDHAVINLGASLFKEGQAYVALSRVRSLDGVRIDELDVAKLTGKKPCNEEAIREMERMRQFRPPDLL